MPKLFLQPILERRQLDWFKPDERQLARHNDPEAIRLCGEDMLANGQLQAVAALDIGDLIFGHGRLLAAKAVGIPDLEVKIYPASLPHSHLLLIRAAENFHRKDMSHYDRWLLCSEILCGNPDWQLKDLAEHLHLDPSSLTRIMATGHVLPIVQLALRDGKIGCSDVYAISKVPENQQAGLLALKLSGASRDQIEAVGRKTRNGGKETVRTQKIVCPLPSKVKIVVSGEAISLDDAIEALGDGIKEMKRGRELGYTSKTFAAAMKDKAKKGGG